MVYELKKCFVSEFNQGPEQKPQDPSFVPHGEANKKLMAQLGGVSEKRGSGGVIPRGILPLIIFFRGIFQSKNKVAQGNPKVELTKFWI